LFPDLFGQFFHKASGDPKKWAKRAREVSEWLAASGRTFSDSTEIIRADRDSRT
jgi:hypothetical protein